MENILEEFKSIQKEYEVVHEKYYNLLNKHGKYIFTQLVTNIMKENNGIVAIGWTQYAPYFNDGEPCEFNVHELFFLNKDDEREDEDDDNISIHDVIDQNYFSDIKTTDSKKLLSSLHNDDYLMRKIFGDDCYVLFTKNNDGSVNLKNRRYSHD